jgi:hypothetical protein
MIKSALRLPHSDVVHVHKRRTRRCIDRPTCAQPKIKQQEHWLTLFGRGRHAPDFPAVEIKPDVVLVYSGSVCVKGLVERTGTNADLPVLRYGPFPLRSIPYVDRSGIPVGHVAIVLDDIHFGRVRCRTIEAIEAHQPKRRPQPLASGQFRPDFKVSNFCANPLPAASTDASSPLRHLPSGPFRASIRRWPSATVNGKFCCGSANLALPKSPFQGVCAIHRVPGPQADTSRWSKSSLKESSRSDMSSTTLGFACARFESRHSRTVSNNAL